MAETTVIEIYGLTDPRTDKVRYVGKSTSSTRRQREHVRDARRGRHCHRSCWIRSLLREGLAPGVRVLETTTEDAWVEAEKRWIREIPDLTNQNEGGLGGWGHLSKGQLRENARRMNDIKTFRERSRTGRRSSEGRDPSVVCGACGHLTALRRRLCRHCHTPRHPDWRRKWHCLRT